jgi:hypothetical protein
MTEDLLKEIKWTAVLVGFIVDLAFSELVGLVIIMIMLALKGIDLESLETLPGDVHLASQVVGVVGAVVGGVAAGYVARYRGSVHGLLGSLMGLFVVFCAFGPTLTIGDVGFIVLNLIGAGYGGGMGERWRARREPDD